MAREGPFGVNPGAPAEYGLLGDRPALGCLRSGGEGLERLENSARVVEIVAGLGEIRVMKSYIESDAANPKSGIESDLKYLDP